MRKIILLLAVPFAFFSTLQAQEISQDASDSIVLERMSLETKPHTVYAKMDSTAGISTAAGELLELDYPCRVYYIKYSQKASGSKCKYLIVNKKNGNLMTVNTANDAPPDLTAWRITPLCDTLPTTVYSLGAGCGWIKSYYFIDSMYVKIHDTIMSEMVGSHDSLYIINSEEELLAHISCTEGSLPAYIDFDKYTLLVVNGVTNGWNHGCSKEFAFCLSQYKLDIDVQLAPQGSPLEWTVVFIVDKLDSNRKVQLSITFKW